MLKIIFLGICCFIESTRAVRTVAVLDLKNGTEVHKHKIQAHRAVIRIPQNAVVSSEWADKVPDKGDYLFPLDHDVLKLEGLPDDVPRLDVQPSHKCLVPHLELECPDFGRLKKIEDVVRSAAAVLDLDYGRLEACLLKNEKGPAASIFTHRTAGNVTIRGTARNGDERIIEIIPNAVVTIENQPAGHEIVPNHFLAYYQLSATSNCCTNIPFGYRPADCPPEQPPVCSTPPGEMSTVACSNSNYP